MVRCGMVRRRISALLLACVVACLTLPACSNDQSSAQRSAATRSHDADDESDRPPYVGMAKEEAIQRYGHPKSIVLTDMGERWTYFLNEGEVAGKSLIPFYIPPRPRFGFLFFGPNGRVREFHWDEVNER